ncbi:MAG: DinB family protein [Candidatus Eisenbacteria bacterium]|nr:DinB family protein [Candidatus Eisenbacteria bacterium]
MKETARIADQLHRSLAGPAWHGPSVLEVLAGLTPKQAAARPISGWKSIWDLALHQIVWQDAVRAHLAGRWPVIKLGGPKDWPPAPKPTLAAWNATLAKLRRSNAALVRAARAFPDSRLDRPLKEGASSAYVQLHGAVQHNLWHAGEMAALKRAQGLPVLKPKA